MNVPELIELIQTHLPEELTPEQIAEIRANLADSPELQDALLAELSMEQSLATKYAPPPTNYEEVIARIGTLAATRERKHWLMWAMAALAVTAVAVGVVLMIRHHRNPVDPSPAIATTQPARGATTRLAKAHVTTAPTTRLAAKDPIGSKDPKDPTKGAPQTRPADIDVVKLPLTWLDYALPGSDEVSGWQSQLPKLFLRAGGAKEPKLSSDRRYVQLSGTYRFGVLPAQGRLLRLDIYSAKKCELEFWNGNNKVRIMIEPNKRIAMESIARRDATSAPTVIDSADDHYRWQSYRFYGLDIRYQDGRIMVCRGEVPLVSVAMARPPVEGKLDCSDLKMYLAEARVVGPLVLPDSKADPASIRKTTAAAFEWKLEPKDKKPEEVELLTNKAGGKVTLLNKVDNVSAKASFEIDAAPSLSIEATVHVTEFCPSATFGIGSELSVDSLRLEPHEDRYILYTSDKKKKAEAVRGGRTFGKEFWMRIRLGSDSWAIWISPDSKRWWRRSSGQSTTLPKRVVFTMSIPSAKDKGVRRTTMGTVTVRRFDAFAKLADPKLVAKAAAALTPEILSLSSRSRILASLAKAADKTASPQDWQMACDTTLIGRASHWQVRCEAVGELLAEATARGNDTDVPKILAAINELSEISWYAGSMGAIQHKALEMLARNCLDTSRHEAIEKIVNTSYLSPVGRHNSYVVAPNLLRLHLLSLISRGEWESVRRETMRSMYHSKDTSHSRDKSILAFTKWALSQAHAHLADKSDPKAAEATATWQHPLVVNDDREMLNTLGEFLFLVQSKHYGPACKRITGRTLLDALVSLDDEEHLLQSSHFRVREIIRNTPELREILNKDYSEIGMIRLERARRQNDLAALKSLAVQFYGSAPGFGAMHVLADRDLSNGNFWGAAARYKLLQSEETYKQRSDAAAKLRLASAMLGQLVGEKVTQPVALPGGTFSPQEFEQMVARLAADRKTAPVTGTTGKVYVGPEPRGRVAKLTYLADIPGGRISSPITVARPAVFAVDAERLIIGYVDKLFAVDRKSRRVLWSHEPDSKQRSSRRRNRRGKTVVALASRPLQIGDKLYVRYGLQGRPLTCVDTKTGKFLWSKRYDDFVLSDPVLIGSWVSVITASRTTSPGLQLHRVSPETGESSLSSELVRVRDQWPTIGRPVVVGDAILFRAEGCLVNCDIRGSVRWARRLPFVPADALPDLHADMALDDIIVHNGNVIFSLPGCPYIMCVSAETAKPLWSFTIHSSAQLLGLHGGSVIVIESDMICALDPDTGKLRWQRRRSSRQAAMLPAAKDTLVSVYLDKPLSATERKTDKGNARHVRRYVRWISCKDGSVLKELPIEGELSAYNVLQVSSDGKRIFGLATADADRKQQPKIFMIEIVN
ncbi:MAG: PQQ-binding-like beta-propeller repeat protein [Phycisphaerae bacterium]|jgi:outer membrane protein assembly factor BamB|nr:PQQ-binding-like beta-propeller repeat protein [Phycisphaerae bacterium]